MNMDTINNPLDIDINKGAKCSSLLKFVKSILKRKNNPSKENITMRARNTLDILLF